MQHSMAVSLALAGWLLAGTTSALATEAAAQEYSVATFGLRGGFDSNPMNFKGGPNSGFINQSATWDYLRGSDKEGYAIAIATNNTVYE
ncbi:hypothetical protein, partial [Stenotrophomonas maltophilia]|uniref:hypothetical protein n=1 Tax=Stenotrophomonas maltophilia TaxID=40324 RepID=UPI00195366C8